MEQDLPPPPPQVSLFPTEPVTPDNTCNIWLEASCIIILERDRKAKHKCDEYTIDGRQGQIFSVSGGGINKSRRHYDAGDLKVWEKKERKSARERERKHNGNSIVCCHGDPADKKRPYI